MDIEVQRFLSTHEDFAFPHKTAWSSVPHPMWHATAPRRGEGPPECESQIMLTSQLHLNGRPPVFEP